MAPSPGAPSPTTPAPLDAATVRRVLAVARRAGAMLLASGAQTTDVELAIAEMSADLGLAGVQVNVTFSSISLSYVERGDLAPTTVIQLVRDRSADFTRLADVAALKNDIAARRVDLAAAEAALDRIEQDDQRFPAWLALVAPAVSAAATAFLFGGGVVDAAATLVVAILVQPLLGALARTGIPPFFTLLLGTTLATLLAAGTVWLGLPVAAPVVLTASLLRFLPGAALVSGIRDLIDQSVVSGTARLAEAILVGAGVASGAALGIAIASQPGVQLELHPEGANEYVLALAMVAAGVAVAGYAVQLSVPTFAIPWTAALGAMAWAIFSTVGSSSPLATFAAAFAVGAAARLLGNRYRAPSTLWVVPAILPLLPGLAIVVALLAPTDLARFSGLSSAILTAFMLGVGVAAGDIVAVTIRRIRRRVVEPAVQTVVIAPLGQLGGVLSRDRGAEASPDEGEPSPDAGGPGRSQGSQ